MTENTATKTTEYWAVEVKPSDGDWVEMPGFSNEDEAKAHTAAGFLADSIRTHASFDAIRVVKVITAKTITEVIVHEEIFA